MPGGTFTTLYSFSGLAADGGEPAAGLVQAPDGNLYGTTTVGGANGIGTTFRITLAGALTTLHSFDPDADGNTPYAALAIASDGKLYGTLSQGAYNSSSGLYAGGTIFSISTAGIYSNIASLPASGALGSSPSARLLQATDGSLYGTTSAGGNNGQGTLFRYNASSGLTALYHFTLADGVPLYGLVESSGMLYGVTFPDTTGYGELFSLTLPGHVFSALFSFTGNSNGGLPATALSPAGNGALFGTTQSAGSADTGTLFQLNSPSPLATLYNFPSGSINTYTDAALLEGSDGNFYDAVIFDSTVGLNASQLDGAGTLFRLAPSQSVAPPVTLTSSAATVSVNQAFTLSWSVAPGSLTAQQCFASSSLPSWTGNKGITGTQSITLSETGTYVFGLTCGGSVSATATVTAGQSLKASAQLTGPSSVPQGQHATLVATVASSINGSPAATGTVTFIADGSITLATIKIKSGAASLTASSAGVPLATYSLTAHYSGDALYSPAISPVLKVTVTSPLISTSTSLTASPNPATVGQSVTLTATVHATSGSGTPTGTVKFLYGSLVIGSAKLSGGVAVLRASSAGVAAGSYPITASYLGDSADKASTSSRVTVKLTK
jgi:uncharacterized repeat protein (TIGR03803 family)